VSWDSVVHFRFIPWDKVSADSTYPCIPLVHDPLMVHHSLPKFHPYPFFSQRVYILSLDYGLRGRGILDHTKPVPCGRKISLPQIFKGQWLRTRYSKRRNTLPVFWPYLRSIRFQGHLFGKSLTVKKKRELFLGQPLTFLSSLASPLLAWA
jgi:hypothetical protein